MTNTFQTTYASAFALTAQLTDDALIFNAVAPGAALPILGALTWGGLTFAEYAMTLVAQPHNDAAFITSVYQNDLGRVPDAQEVAFYENVITHDFNGYAKTILYVGVSPESHAHNAGLLVHFG